LHIKQQYDFYIASPTAAMFSPTDTTKILLSDTARDTFDAGFLSKETMSTTVNGKESITTNGCSSIHVNDQPPDKRTSLYSDDRIVKKRRLDDDDFALFGPIPTSTSLVCTSSTSSVLLSDDMVLQELSLFVTHQPLSPPLSPSTSSLALNDDDIADDFVLFP
jgi:hypothetical protein